jgi:hypothetical protein
MNEAQLATPNRKAGNAGRALARSQGEGYQRCGKDIAKIRSCAINEA